MSVSPHDRAPAAFTTVASAVCCAPEPPRSAKFNSRWDIPSVTANTVNRSAIGAFVMYRFRPFRR